MNAQTLMAHAWTRCKWVVQAEAESGTRSSPSHLWNSPIAHPIVPLPTWHGEKEPLKIPHVHSRLKIRTLRFFPPRTQARPEIRGSVLPPCRPLSCTPSPSARKAGEAKNTRGSEDVEAVGKNTYRQSSAVIICAEVSCCSSFSSTKTRRYSDKRNEVQHHQSTPQRLG
jgi:hypothetical protein